MEVRHGEGVALECVSLLRHPTKPDRSSDLKRCGMNHQAETSVSRGSRRTAETNPPRLAAPFGLLRAGAHFLLLFRKSTLPTKFCHRVPAMCEPDAYRLAHQAFGAVMKVTPEVVERINRLRRLGRRIADIARLCGLSEPTVKKVLRRATTKKSATETQDTGRKIDKED